MGLDLLFEIFRSHSFSHTTLSRTSLDEWSARCKDLYLKTLNTHNRLTSTPTAGFETEIPAKEQSHAHALYRAANYLYANYWITRVGGGAFGSGLRYKPKGGGFHFRWGQDFFFIFSFQAHYGPGVDPAFNRNEYQWYLLGGKGGRCVGLTTLPTPLMF
jgi:hypothetical protein